MKLIDHQHAFSYAGPPESDLYDAVKESGDAPIPVALVDAMGDWLSDWPPPELPDLLDPGRLGNLGYRVFEVVSSGKL